MSQATALLQCFTTPQYRSTTTTTTALATTTTTVAVFFVVFCNAYVCPTQTPHPLDTHKTRHGRP
jgi:hypothetical protein